MNRIIGLTLVIFTLFAGNLKAQFKLDAEYKPRFEYRHGFKTLFPNNATPATFVSQRARLNTNYKNEKLEFRLSIQDVRVWGDVPQLNSSDNNSLMVYEAWAKINMKEYWAVKIGRQEIIYDDSRFFGNVDWAQQGRSHDLAMIKFNKKSLSFDVGIAYNQDRQALTGNTQETLGTYKTFQYVWLNKKWSDFSASLLFLNNGLQYIDILNADNNETRYSQTLGTHLKYTKNKLQLSSNLYYQFGIDVDKNGLAASLLSIDANYAVSNYWTIGMGFEYMSGNENGAPDNGENRAFTPFYGTNHKFNGYMDYFYVGNHINNVGLKNLYVTSKLQLSDNANFLIAFHNFSSAANLTGTSKKQLGSEIDIVYTYSIQKNVSIKLGYSQLLANEGMEILKNNTDGNTNNWGWIMLVVKPTLFDSSN
jgi:hypothetical protein